VPVLKRGRFIPGSNSPKVFRPSDAPAPQAELVRRLETAMAAFEADAAAARTTTFDHPFFGRLRLIDFVRFQEIHTNHHRGQLAPAAARAGGAMNPGSRLLTLISCLMVAASPGLVACGADAGGPSGEPDRTLFARAGEDVELKLQTIGPGKYLTPPAVLSTVVRFVDVREAGVVVPAGETQIFRFRAVRPGTAFIAFRHSEQNRNLDAVIHIE
jgi:hypothetical protein